MQRIKKMKMLRQKFLTLSSITSIDMMNRIREKQSFLTFPHPVHPASEANPVKTLSYTENQKLHIV
jgi:hypothetical protein